ncbi:MAG TPA: ATP-dependent DNA helicase [Steroidobacteraceae bacterium]|nr:ATP-dependent DNA helicase [Steroidobacteraceae bacterium]
MLTLRDIFSANGPLQRSVPDFTLRRQQLRMAERVAEALESRESLVVEAGTGTGKTFAYLVPALLSGCRVLISTGTRTLQDQLFTKDLPLVSAALGRPARVALLKGRANYLCRHRLEQARDEAARQSSLAPDPWLARIARWAEVTASGDLAEVPGLSDSHPLWPQVTSTRDNCLGTQCAELARCHVAAARRRAQEADIVIVNHHLLLADLALREDGFADILGSADGIILDEAHQLPDLATQFFGATFGSRRIESILQSLAGELASSKRSSAADPGSGLAVTAAMRDCEEALRRLAALVPHAVARVAWEEYADRLAEPASELAHALHELGRTLQGSEAGGALGQLGMRTSELADQLERIADFDAHPGARGVEVGARGFALQFLPFDVAERFRAHMAARSCAWIFTSATLCVGADFEHFTARLGLHEAATLKIESPFDYERQSLLYLPPGLPEPAAPGYTGAVLQAALPLIAAARGGAFVLFTSHRALAEGAQLLRRQWGSKPPYRVYVQGEAPREQLLQDFRADGDGVLLGTASFWEGVDVKGTALRLVIIDKLPFASPDDPLVKARIAYIESIGGNAFRDFQLPEAALTLKQGVGRLIRGEQDYGAVMICDRRLVERSYGRVLLTALPPMSCTRDPEDVLRFLRRHAPAPSPRKTMSAGSMSR